MSTGMIEIRANQPNTSEVQVPKTRMMLIGALVALAIPAAAMAQAKGGDTLIYRANLMSINPTSDTTIFGTKLEADSALGADLNFEYKLMPKFGIEAAVLYAKQDVKQDGVKAGDITQTPLLFSGNFHLTEGKPVDFYVGPTLGYNFWGDVKPNDGGPNFKTDGEFVYGVNAGIDVPFKGSKWAFTAGLRYLQSGPKVDFGGVVGKQSVDVNPLAVRAGVAYRY